MISLPWNVLHPKVKAVGLVAIVFAILLGIQAAAKMLPDSPWAVAIEAGVGPVIAFGAGYMTPSKALPPPAGG